MSRKNIKAIVGGLALLTAVSISNNAFASYEGFGSGIPLNLAANEIVPQGWSVDYGEGVDNKVNISWSSAADWKQALQKAVGEHGYSASFGTNSVVISKTGGASKPSTPSAAKATNKVASNAASKPRASRPAPRKAPEVKAEAPLQGGGGFTIRPYRGGKPAEDVKSPEVEPRADRLATKGQSFEPYKPVASQFSVVAGQMLHPTLAEWASKSGWTVVWESEYDYRIEAGANFSGDFQEAVTAIVTAMSEARPAITVDFYKGNNVAVISNKSADSVN